MRKRSSHGVVLRGLNDLGRSAMFAEICSVVDLLSIHALEMPSNVSC